MAEDRKPKIDLKSRLQKMGGPAGVATPPPPAAGSVPAPSMPPLHRAPYAPGLSPVPPPSVPPPPGMSRPPPAGALDPNNPLAAVAKPFVQSRAPAHVAAQPHRIEVDEDAVRQARGRAFKGGLTAGLVVAAMVGGVGFMSGNASSQGAARSQGIRDAHDLAADLLKARDSLTAVQQKLQEGGKSLIGDRKYPAALGQQLAGMNVDFAGDKLFGRRFSGVPADTTRQLFDFIVRIEALNSKKDLVVSLLSKLQKPITEELSRPAGQLPISYVVIVDKDSPDMGAFLAPLAAPIVPGEKTVVPNELTFLNPRGGGKNVSLPRLKDDRIPKDGAAMTVVPNTFDKLCPSATHGQIAQLISTMNSLADDIQGQKGQEGGDAVTETKAGLGEVAAKLADQLNKVN